MGTLWSRVHVGSSVLGVSYGAGYMWGVVTLVLNNHAVQRHETKTKLLIFDF